MLSSESMAGMPPHGEPVSPGDGRNADEPAQRPRRGDLETFTPMAFDGLAWSRITGPQQDARAACLLVTAFVHLFNPELALRDLDARAEPAIRALEDGAPAVMVIDDRHRVDRAGLSVSVSGMA
jgi:hypothetical protein